jgi:hypothetical protein
LLQTRNVNVSPRSQRQSVTLSPRLAAKRRGLQDNKGQAMKRAVFAGVLFALIAAPAAAQAQGVPGGAAHGFHEGNRIAGPVGAVVGTAVGGVIGGVEGVLGVNRRPVAYSPDADVPPRPYRYRKAVRAKVKHARRVNRSPQPGTVN